MHPILKAAIKHPIAFVKGTSKGIYKLVKSRRDPNYVPMTTEEADRAWEENMEKLKKLL